MGRAATQQELADLLGEAPQPSRQQLTPWANTPTGTQRVGLSKHAGNSKATPARLRKIVEELRKLPIVSEIERRVGCSHTALKYWLHKSASGYEGDGFDIVMNPDAPEDEQVTLRFHEAYDEALLEGIGQAEVVLYTRATGYAKPLTFQGRVIYREDPDLLALGLVGPEAWLRDPVTKQPIPETVWEQDPDLLTFMLKARKPEVYGNKQQIDVTHRGGVLVVAAKATTGQQVQELEKTFRDEAIDVEFDDVDEEE